MQQTQRNSPEEVRASLGRETSSNPHLDISLIDSLVNHPALTEVLDPLTQDGLAQNEREADQAEFMTAHQVVSSGNNSTTRLFAEEERSIPSSLGVYASAPRITDTDKITRPRHQTARNAIDAPLNLSQPHFANGVPPTGRSAREGISNNQQSYQSAFSRNPSDSMTANHSSEPSPGSRPGNSAVQYTSSQHALFTNENVSGSRESDYSRTDCSPRKYWYVFVARGGCLFCHLSIHLFNN